MEQSIAFSKLLCFFNVESFYKWHEEHLCGGNMAKWISYQTWKLYVKALSSEHYF